MERVAALLATSAASLFATAAVAEAEAAAAEMATFISAAEAADFGSCAAIAAMEASAAVVMGRCAVAANDKTSESLRVRTRFTSGPAEPVGPANRCNVQVGLPPMPYAKVKSTVVVKLGTVAGAPVADMAAFPASSWASANGKMYRVCDLAPA